MPLIPIAMALAQFAPGIIKLLTGSDKAGDVAAQVVGIAQTVTGASTPDAALAAIQADPNKVLEFQQAMSAQQVELEKAYLADVADARARDVALAQAGRYNWRADFLALLAVSGLIICVWFVARDTSLPERAVNAIMFVAGTLSTCVRDVFGYEFGSSRGSREKNDMLANLKR